uniref:TSC22 domain family protein 3 n=1 Tax=Salarias fasciatus TaxID=181472 RepID=A0A672GFL6_SALFA
MKRIFWQQHPPSGASDSDPQLCPQRRPLSTPPLPVRRLQVAQKKPGTPVALRSHIKVKGHGSVVRESWPGALTMTSHSSRSGDPLTLPSKVTPCEPENQERSSIRCPPPGHTLPPVLQPCCSFSDGRSAQAANLSLLLFCHSGSCNSLLSIDTKVEQAMDLVKNHLMLAVREEVELLRERIRELQEKNQELERENHILRALTHNMTTQHNRRERTTS